MGNAGWLSLAVAATLMILPMGIASPAALEAKVVASALDPLTQSTRGGYATPVVVADVSGKLLFANLDPIDQHDVISFAESPTFEPWCERLAGHHDCPLFASPLLRPKGLDASVDEAEVEGIDRLVPGQIYDFYCSEHHWMIGKLVAI